MKRYHIRVRLHVASNHWSDFAFINTKKRSRLHKIRVSLKLKKKKLLHRKRKNGADKNKTSTTGHHSAEASSSYVNLSGLPLHLKFPPETEEIENLILNFVYVKHIKA